MKSETDMWREMDRILLGSNDRKTLEQALERLGDGMALRMSSLGRYLGSTRKALKHSFAEMAHQAGVDTQTWKSWEYDFATPSKAELEEAMNHLKWSRLQREQAWELWENAARFRLRRLTTLKPDYLAAKGLSSESNIGWNSISEKSRLYVQSWGRRNGYSFPEELAEFLAGLETDEERERWVNEVLGGD